MLPGMGCRMAETEDDIKVWDETIRLIKLGHMGSWAKIQAQRNLNIWRKPNYELTRKTV